MDGPTAVDRGLLVLAWVALVVGAGGAVMLGPHFTLFGIGVFVPPYLGVLQVAHERGLRTPECRQCGRYVEVEAVRAAERAVSVPQVHAVI